MRLPLGATSTELGGIPKEGLPTELVSSNIKYSPHSFVLSLPLSVLVSSTVKSIEVVYCKYNHTKEEGYLMHFLRPHSAPTTWLCSVHRVG
jgi:hypothetical protein